MPPPPVLDLDFSTMATLPSFITFGRSGSVATYRDVDGLLKNAGANVPRFHVDPISGKRGFLSEASRTNLALHSEAFDNAQWVKDDATISVDVAVAPDGATTADKLVEVGPPGNKTHSVRQDFTKAASAITYTASVFAKKDQRDRFQFLCNGTNFGDRVQATFDLSAGTISSAIDAHGNYTATAARIIDYKNGWYRCQMTFTSNTDTDVRIRMTLHDGTSTNYTGDGTSGLFLWGAQLEEGALPTTYIPTAAASVARGADFARIAPADAVPFLSATAQTMMAEFVLLGADSNTGSTRLVLSSCISSQDRNSIGVIGSGAGAYDARVVVGNVGQATMQPTGPAAAGQLVRLAGSFKASDFAAVANGGTPVTLTSGSYPTTIDRIGIGNIGSSATAVLQGIVTKAYIWTTNLTAAQLQTITTAGWSPGNPKRTRLTISMGLGI